MAWLAGLRKKHLVPEWKYSTDGILWRLIPSAEGFFVGEDRDSAAKRVSFFCLEQKTGSVVWQKITLSEPWWIGIETICEGIILFHEYAAPDMPDHKKIIAVDLRSGKTIWSNDDVRFLFAHDGRIYTVQDGYQDRVFHEIDLYTGKVMQEVQAEYLNVVRDTVAVRDDEVVEFPVEQTQYEVMDTAVQTTMEKELGDARQILYTEFLEMDTQLVIGAYKNISHTPVQVDLEQHVLIIDRATESISYHDIPNTHVITPVPDTIFGVGDMVYYIKKKKTLLALKLPKH